jgi:hypothetical protein
MGLTTKKKLPCSATRFDTRYVMFVVANNFEQFEELLLETDVTVGVARRILEKRNDLKNRAFNDYKKEAEKKCVVAVGSRAAFFLRVLLSLFYEMVVCQVEDIVQRRHLQSQPLVKGWPCPLRIPSIARNICSSVCFVSKVSLQRPL